MLSPSMRVKLVLLETGKQKRNQLAWKPIECHLSLWDDSKRWRELSKILGWQWERLGGRGTSKSWKKVEWGQWTGEGRMKIQDVLGLSVQLENREMADRKSYRLNTIIRKWKKTKWGNRGNDKVRLELFSSLYSWFSVLFSLLPCWCCNLFLNLVFLTTVTMIRFR